MAENNAHEVACKYYMHGACMRGSGCLFKHDRAAQADNVCRYYLKGACSYGTKCRYDHTKPSSKSSKFDGGGDVPPSSLTTGGGQGSSSSGPSTSRTTTNNNDNNQINLVPLRSLKNNSSFNSNQQQQQSSNNILALQSTLRVEAAEFVPSFLTSSTQPSSSSTGQHYGGGRFDHQQTDDLWQQADGSGNDGLPPPPPTFSYANKVAGYIPKKPTAKDKICPYNITGECYNGELNCPYTHGLPCEMCGRFIIHPYNQEHNRIHHKECVEEHEREMEKAFAAAASQDKECTICTLKVLENERQGERRFGILPNCNHCFCLTCIRTWRRQADKDNEVIDKTAVKGCPMCRAPNEFVVPSMTWIDDADEKKALIQSYKDRMVNINCKYFQAENRECPFGNKCFYKHVTPEGQRVEGEDPKVVQQRIRNREARSRDTMLADFLELRGLDMDDIDELDEFDRELLLDINWDSDTRDNNVDDHRERNEQWLRERLQADFGNVLTFVGDDRSQSAPSSPF